MNL
ncbi:hypothetical protein CP8484711_1845A, partial [Chlamydia psittaci 84-8471/1]|jgi:hypothetical protein